MLYHCLSKERNNALHTDKSISLAEFMSSLGKIYLEYKCALSADTLSSLSTDALSDKNHSIVDIQLPDVNSGEDQLVNIF